MSLTRNIKQVMLILKKAIDQAPLDKQPLLSLKLTKVIDKYSGPNQQSNQAAYLKELEFNLNFIRLSFPHLDYSPPSEKQPEKANSSAEEQITNHFFELENQKEMEKFMEETQQAVKGIRQEVQFSNWVGGNVDPEDLKRHKELLRRQYFGGQFWKGKQKPVSPTAAYLMELMEGEPPKERIVVEDDEKEVEFEGGNPEDRWQKVKR